MVLELENDLQYQMGLLSLMADSQIWRILMRIMHIFLFSPLLMALAPGLACSDDPESPTSSTTTSTSSSGTGGQGGEGGEGGGGGQGGSGGGVSECEPESLEVYDGAGYDTNAKVEVTLRAQFTALNDLMRTAEVDLANKPTAAEITALYEAGNPSIKDVTTMYYDGRVLDWFADFEAAAGNTWMPTNPPAGPGGKYGNYIFSAFGTDLRQAVEKGLFTAAFYNRALMIMKNPLDAAAMDRLVTVFGAHPDFPGSSEISDPAIVPHPDRLWAQYAERRSPKDPNDSKKPADPKNPGPYFRIKADFIRAKAAVAKGSACDAARDEALSRIMLEWERVMGATVIYYLNDASLKLTKENPTDSDLAGGLHGYGETMAFIHGFRGLPADARVITDAQIDALLESIGAPHDADATSYLLVTDPATEVPKLLAAADEIAKIYGFSAQEVELFKVNH